MSVNEKERRDRIIETVVTTYLETGRPVGSAYVSEQSGLGLKPASVRACMKDLEDQGYLSQPHTSAGRVPTVKCYRYYVSRLMPEVNLASADAAVLTQVVEDRLREHDAEVFMGHMATTLAEITDLIGVALAPAFDTGVFDRLEIVGLGGSRYLLVISIAGGFVNTIHITLTQVVPRRQVEETARLITERLHGLSLGDIRRTIGDRLRNTAHGNLMLVEVILRMSGTIFALDGDRAVHVAGLSRVLSHPDFAAVDTSRLAALVEKRSELARLLNDLPAHGSDVAIRIGESIWTEPPLSFITAPYCIGGDAAGSIALIGPPRVPYPRLAALVRYAAAVTARYLASN
jgi:heat-inducible transcriptional repressor